jgi:hypothetical protein
MATQAVRVARRRLLVLVVAAMMLAMPATSLAALQTTKNEIGKAVKPAVETTKPLYEQYRGVAIGAEQSVVHEKLGNPTSSDDGSDIYILSDNESTTVYYDKDKRVLAIATTYSGAKANAPTPQSIFGVDVAAETNGSISKMVRYTDAGYWVSYNRLAGDEPLVILTIKKIEHP